MKRRFMALMMTLCLAAGLLAGCGNSESAGGNTAAADTKGGDTGSSADKSTAKSDDGAETGTVDAGTTTAADDENGGDVDDEDASEIVVAYPTTYATPDLATVEAAVNEITTSKINVEVKLMPFELGSYNDQLNLMISSGEKLDTMVSFFYGSTEFTSMASQNQLEPLDELLTEYGQGILETLPEKYMETTKINGRTLGVPVYKDNVATIYLAMRTDVLEKLQLTEQAQNIKSVDDIEAILKAVKENEPSLVPMFCAKDQGVLTCGCYLSGDIADVVTYDPLYQEQIVAFPDIDSQKAISVFHSDAYEAAVTKMHDWYEKGYVFKDSATTELTTTTAIQNDVAFAMVFAAENATMMSTVQDCGYEMTVIPLAYQRVTSQKISQLDWVIPVTSTEPEAAMKFMNLLYTDADLVNLMNYGVEGVHYVKNDNGTISLPEGKDASSVGYYGNLSFLIGNQYLSYVWDTYAPDTRAKSKEINDNAQYSALLGFAFDSSAYANEISAVTNVVSEYNNAMITGISDPATTLQEFRDKLDSSGMQTLVDGIQEQLDAWLEENK